MISTANPPYHLLLFPIIIIGTTSSISRAMAPPLPPASRRSGLASASASIVEMMQVERVQQGGARAGPLATLHPYMRLLSVVGGGGGGRRTWGDAVTLRSLQVQPGSPRGQLCFNASGFRTPGTVLRLVLRRRVLEFKTDLQGEGDFLSVGVSVLSVHPTRPPRWLGRSTISLARRPGVAGSELNGGAVAASEDTGSGSKTGLQPKHGTGSQPGGGSESEGGLESGPGVEPTAKPEPGSEVEPKPRLEFGLPVGLTGKPESGLELDPPGVGPKPQPTPAPESKPGSDRDPATGPISKPGARSESGPRRREPPPPPPPVASPNPDGVESTARPASGPGVRREPDRDRGFAAAAAAAAAGYYDVFDVTPALGGAGDPASLCFSLRFSDEAGSLVLHHELARSFYALEHRGGGGDDGGGINNDANNNDDNANNHNNAANHNNNAANHNNNAANHNNNAANHNNNAANHNNNAANHNNAAPPLLLAYVDLPAR
ncbi:uncharacterized protein LOC142923971 [Petromyzon marinus]|uniref:uncharacterized protein LOC142923971 n=1 Tax=Petromyzon marinus TaxID=7757 RepID=UPI003F6F61C0